MSYWIRTIVETVLWLGASVVALALLERVDAIAELARAARSGPSGAAPQGSPTLH